MIDIIKLIPIAPMCTLLLFIITYAVNNWDVTELENKLMTNFQKVKIVSSVLFLVSIGAAILSVSIEWLKENENDTKLEFDYELLLMAIVFLVIYFLIGIIGYAFVRLIVFIITNKTNYYITFENPNEKWYVVRRVNKKYILVKFAETFKFVENWYEKDFVKEIGQLNRFQEFLYKNKIRFYTIIILLVSISASLFYSLYKSELDDISSFISYAFCIVGFSIAGVMWLTYKSVNKIEQEQQEQQENEQ